MHRRIVVLAALSLLVSSSAFANISLRTRTFVSGVGVDTGTCPPATPCRTFAYALTQTAGGGEIIAVDTAGFGAVTITQPITILAVPGALASIAADGSVAADIIINANTTDSVSLKNIVFDSTGVADGIDFNSGGFLHVENCTFTNFTGNGINVTRSAAADMASVFIDDSTFRETNNGVFVRSTGAGSKAFVTIDRSSFKKGGIGLAANENCRAVVRDSVFSGMTLDGVLAFDTVGANPSEVLLERTSISNCAVAVTAFATAGSATVRISDSSIIDNADGLSAAAFGQILGRQQGTLGTNTVEGNGADNDFTAHYASK
jgi:hypothetical protein